MIRCAITRTLVRRPSCSTAVVIPRKQRGQLAMLQYTCLCGPHAEATRMHVTSAVCSPKSRNHYESGVREARSLMLVRHMSPSFTPDMHHHGRLLSSSASSSSSAREGYPIEPVSSPLWQRIVKFVLKLAAGLVLMSVTIITLLPAIISTTTGLHATLAVANRFLPGHVAIDKVSLPAARPVMVPMPLHGANEVNVHQCMRQQPRGRSAVSFCMLELMIQITPQPVGRLLVLIKAPGAAGSYTDVV